MTSNCVHPVTTLMQAENALDYLRKYAETNSVPKEEFNRLYMRMTKLLHEAAIKKPKSQSSLDRYINK